MPIASGQRITAALLRHLQPTTYSAVGTGPTPQGANVPVPGATITLTTATAGATYVAQAVWDVQQASAVTTVVTARISVDGALQPPLGTYQGATATDRATITQTYRGTLPAAGTHTIALVATTAAGQTVQGTNSSLLVTIYEAV